MAAGAAPKASGYFHWLDTWVTNEYERADANFPVWRSSYSEIKFHSSKYVSEPELVRANVLVHQLSAYDGRDFPRNIDNQFDELAAQKISSRSYLIQFEIYAKRTYYLLLNPFSSWGLPLEVNGSERGVVKNAIDRFDFSELTNFIANHKYVVFGKFVVFVYRVVIFLAFPLITIFAVFRLSNRFQWDFRFETRVLILATVAVALTRVSFFVFIGGLESRYLVEVMTWVECCLMLCVFGGRRKRNVDH